MIKYMVTQLGGTYEDAKDVFQEGLMIILEKIDNRNFTLTCKFKTYLYCICEYQWKTALTKRQTAANYLQNNVVPEEYTDISEQLDDDLRMVIFRKAYDKIDPAGKTILKLYWEGFSPQEIAEKLNYTYGYVKKKKCEAQALLIEKVKSHPEYKNIKMSEEIIKNVIY